MKKLTRLAFLCFLWVGVLPSAVRLLHGQTVTFTGSPVNFGNINVCGGTGTTPAPCSKIITLNYKVTEGGKLGTAAVLTLGAFGGDFRPGSSTCTGNLTAGATCVVQAKFEPRSPGLRLGAVEIIDGSGNVVTTTFIHGVGIGPQMTFDGGLAERLLVSPNSNIFWAGVAVDGYGRLFISNGEGPHEAVAPAVYELWNGQLFTVGTGFNTPQQVAIDGAGTLYVTDTGTRTVIEIPQGCAASSCQRTLDGGFAAPYGIAVDGAGNLYVTDVGNSRVLELPLGCTSSACEIPIGSVWSEPTAIAVDSAGNVFVVDPGHQRVERVAAGGGGQTTVVSDLRYSSGIAVDAAGDLFVSDLDNGRIFQVPAGGGAQRTIASGLDQPQGLALDSAGNLFFSQIGSHDGIGEINRAAVPITEFASTSVGSVSSDSPRTVILGNGGNTPLSFTQVLFEPNPNFTLQTGDGTPPDCASSLSLAPGAICDLSMRFTPTEEGVLIGTVVLNDNNLNPPVLATQMPLFEGAGTPGGPGIDFTRGFTSTAPGVTLNGGATIQGNNLQLTDGGTYEARSAFFPTPIGVSSFDTQFDFELGGKDIAGTEGDGLAFVLQSNSPNALGSAGGGLGYGLPGVGQSGPSITNSIAIKFDLHSNDGEGSDSTGLYRNGAAPTVPSINLLPSINLHSGHVFHVELVYDGTILTLTITDKSTNVTVSYPFTVDIAGILGGPTGYAGFTGSTGAKTTVENILDWQVTSSECCMAGEPNFPDGFTNSSAITLNGEAAFVGGNLQLVTDIGVERSSAWFSTAVPINKFSTDFDFVMTPVAGLTGEGFTFVVQSAGLSALGSSGAGLGYATIEHSVAVKFDIHSDAGEGSNSTGVYVGGALPTVPATNLPSGIDLHGGHLFHARLNYDGVNLKVSITDLSQYAVFTGTYPVNIPLAVGGDSAYAGFTAASGSGLANTTKILNWSMSSY